MNYNMKELYTKWQWLYNNEIELLFVKDQARDHSYKEQVKVSIFRIFESAPIAFVPYSPNQI